MRKRDRQDYQKKILGLDFGPGLTLESMLLRFELVLSFTPLLKYHGVHTGLNIRG
jgi:hypothetical protein